MPAATNTRVPKYRHHKPSGLASVRLAGRDVYLGPHGTPQSRETYKRVVAEWLANHKATPPRAVHSFEKRTRDPTRIPYLRSVSTIQV